MTLSQSVCRQEAGSFREGAEGDQPPHGREGSMGANEVVVLFDPTKPLDTDYVLCIACDTIEQLMQESG